MAVTLTAAAAKHVGAFLAKRGKGVGLRLGVRTTGCSGLAYKLEYVDEARPEDLTFESQGITVVIDPKSLPYIDGTELARGIERRLQVQQSERQGCLRLWGELQRLSPAPPTPRSRGVRLGESGSSNHRRLRGAAAARRHR